MFVVIFETKGQTNDENWDRLGCNNFEGEYSPDYCYGSGLSGESEKFVCINATRLAKYEYNSSDCSGDAESTTYYGDGGTFSWYDSSYFQCNASSNCEFATLEDFYSGNDCAQSSRDWSYQEVLIGVCAQLEYGDWSSYEASCTSTSITISEYTSDDCSGTAGNVTTYTNGNVFPYYDGAVYCSSDSGYGECNSGEMIMMNKYYIHLFIGVAILRIIH